MSVHPQATEAKSDFVRKERKVREEKQSIFVSSRFSRPSRTDAFASVFAWRRNNSNNSPQMNANEREFAFARHSGAGRNPFSGMMKINMDPGFRRDDGVNGVVE